MTKKQEAQLTEQQRVEKAANAKAQRRARFLKLAPARVNRAMKALASLANCGNRQGYDYTKEDVDKIVAAIKTAAGEVIEGFAENSKRKGTFTL